MNHNSRRNRTSVLLVFSRFLVCVALGTLLAACASFNETKLTQDEVTAHIQYLASDELQGRGTGTEGGEMAAAYIAARFEEWGVRPMPEFSDYFQRIPLEKSKPAESGHLEILGKSYELNGDLLVLSGNAHQGEMEAVFAGEDLGSIDSAAASGKAIVTRISGDPGRARRALFSLAQHAGEAADKGAVALIEFYQGEGWPMISGFLNRERVSLPSEDAPATIPHILIQEGDAKTLAKLDRARNLKLTLDTSGRAPEKVNSSNVIGYAPGTDPALKDEYVILTAHYDHLGIGQARPEDPEDTIYNGARDNGMGTVAVLAAAKSLAASPAKRPVVFLALTGEERGLLGSRYYIGHPAVPLEKTVFVLNVDTGEYGDTSIVSVIGLERTSARPQIEAGCADFQLEAIVDPVPDQNLFNRSDNVAFARKGIPAPTFSPGFRSFTPDSIQYYHRPNDEADENFDFAYLLRFSQAFARSGRLIADAPESPAWTPGDPYEGAYRKLHGQP